MSLERWVTTTQVTLHGFTEQLAALGRWDAMPSQQPTTGHDRVTVDCVHHKLCVTRI